MATNDMKAAKRTYGSFVANLKWIVPLLCVVTLIIVILIAD